MKKIKKLKNYFLAFIIPFIICIAILNLKNIFTNPDNMFVTDLRGQHITFLNYFKNILLGKASIHYSFYAGMGSTMIATMIFYAISPINLLLLLINDLQFSIIFIYITKISLASLTMYILLKRKINKDDFSTILFAISYALCSFAINYFFCIFWFDSLYLAPLVIIGIDKIFEHQKINLLYIIALSLTILCNIQMGFELCIFSAIYFLYSFNTKYDFKKDIVKLKRLSLIFIISSLCAGAISSGALLGFLSEYNNIEAARSLNVASKTGISNIGYILKNIFTVGTLKETFYNEVEPYIYSSIIVTLFSILYLFQEEIPKKKRTHTLIVILIFIASFCIQPLNKLWHLTPPVHINFRYSAYLTLFLTIIAYECYCIKTKITKKDIIVLSISILIGLSMIVAYPKEIYIATTFIFLTLSLIFIILSKNKSKKFEVALLIVMLSEVCISTYTSFYTIADLKDSLFSSHNYAPYKSLQKISTLNKLNSDYRIMYNYSYTEHANDSLLLNQNTSLRYFSSVINGRLPVFFDKNVSMTGNNNYRVSAYDSPLLLSLLGNKYMYLSEEIKQELYEEKDKYQVDSYNYQKEKKDKQDIYFYENPYALSLGYIIEKDINSKKEKNIDLVDYQNNIIKSFSGINKDVMIRLKYEATDSEQCDINQYQKCITFNIENHTETPVVYFYGMYQQLRTNNNTNLYSEVDRPIMISTLDNNIDLEISYTTYFENENITFATYNKDNLIESLNKLKENMLKNIKIKNNIMTAEIDAHKKGILFLSIPYDKNFKIYVDGKKVKYYPVLDKTFIGLDIKEEGLHKIKLENKDNNLKIYILITLSSTIITIVLYLLLNKKIEKKIELERIEEERKNTIKAKKKKKKK